MTENHSGRFPVRWFVLGGCVLLAIAAGLTVRHQVQKSEEAAARKIEEEAAGPAKPDSAVIAAWEKAGAKFGWMGVNELGFISWRPKPKPSADDIPGFKFLRAATGKLSGSLRGLPQPAIPFALGCRNADDAALKELAGMKQLQSLNLTSGQVTDAGLKELAGLTQLQTLWLFCPQVTDAGLKELAGLMQLQTLNLSNTSVTGAGLKELAGLMQLQSLNLRLTSVTDAGLKELAGLKQLQWLHLGNTKVTDAGLKELKQALPKCDIHR